MSTRDYLQANYIASNNRRLARLAAQQSNTQTYGPSNPGSADLSGLDAQAREMYDYYISLGYDPQSAIQEALLSRENMATDQTTGATYPNKGGNFSSPDSGSALYGAYSATGGSGGEVYQPNYIFFNGTQYDLNDPGSADAYYSAQRDYYAAEAGNTYSQNLQGLNQDIENLGRSQEQYGRGAARNITDLGEGYDLGTVKRGQFYGGIAPRAYESSQGSSQLYAQGKLQQGVGDVTSALEEANRQFNQQKEGLTQERSGLEQGYNSYLQQLSDYYNTQGANGFGGSGPSAYSYSRNQFKPYEGKFVDLSGVTPFTTFNNLPGAQQPNTQQPTGGYQAPHSYQDIASYLGYTPDQKEQDLLNRYLSLGY